MGRRGKEMGSRDDVSFGVDTLAAIGAVRLAEILYSAACEDDDLRRRLEAELRRLRPRQDKAVAAMAGSIERRIAALESMDGYHDWRGAASIGNDIDSLRRDIVEAILPIDAKIAANRLEQLVDLGHLLFETCDDSDGEVGDALMAVVEDWGRAWVRVGDRDRDEIAEIVFDAFTDNEYGALDEIIPAFAEALGDEGLAALEERFRAALNAASDAADDETSEDSGEGWSREWRWRVHFLGLQEIADVRGDIDAFVVAHEEAGTDGTYAIDIAARLHRAGRPEEALRWLERPDRRSGGIEDETDLHVAILDALGREADAVTMRWSAFEKTLSFRHFDDCRRRAVSPAEEEIVHRRAVEHTLTFDGVCQALEFLVAAGALAEASEMVMRREAEIRGAAFWALRPAAEALPTEHPETAVLLYRRMAEAVLRAGKSQAYGYAVSDLREAAIFAEKIDEWRDLEPHETFMERLRAEHGRKWSFWKQW